MHSQTLFHFLLFSLWTDYNDSLRRYTGLFILIKDPKETHLNSGEWCKWIINSCTLCTFGKKSRRHIHMYNSKNTKIMSFLLNFQGKTHAGLVVETSIKTLIRKSNQIDMYWNYMNDLLLANLQQLLDFNSISINFF